AFLGRISPEKGLEIAIRVARRTGLPLKIAARKPLQFSRDPNVRQDWRYFHEVIEPLLDASGVDFIGEVGGREKDAFLGGAMAEQYERVYDRLVSGRTTPPKPSPAISAAGGLAEHAAAR